MIGPGKYDNAAEQAHAVEHVIDVVVAKAIETERAACEEIAREYADLYGDADYASLQKKHAASQVADAIAARKKS